MARRKREKCWRKLTDEQLSGARYGLRVLLTSPTFVGRCREILIEYLDDTTHEMNCRVKERQGIRVLSKF